MKKAFTLIELLVVIAIIAILAAILFPVFAQAKVAAKKSASLSNTKQLATATVMYQADYDDVFPRGFGYYPGVGHGWSNIHDVPADWRNPGPVYLEFVKGSPSNTLQPYMKNFSMLEAPGAPVVNFPTVTYTGFTKAPQPVGYSYNGLLHTYSGTAVASVATTPVWTQLNGDNLRGFDTTVPTLYCDDANAPCNYVPPSASCGTTGNGQLTVLFTNVGKQWIYGKNQTWAYADGHAKTKFMGMNVNGRTDYKNDPYSRYSATGQPGGGWYDQYYCHSLTFAPDYDGSTIVGTPFEEIW